MATTATKIKTARIFRYKTGKGDGPGAYEYSFEHYPAGLDWVSEQNCEYAYIQIPEPYHVCFSSYDRGKRKNIVKHDILPEGEWGTPKVPEAYTLTQAIRQGVVQIVTREEWENGRNVHA